MQNGKQGWGGREKLLMLLTMRYLFLVSEKHQEDTGSAQPLLQVRGEVGFTLPALFQERKTSVLTSSIKLWWEEVFGDEGAGTGGTPVLTLQSIFCSGLVPSGGARATFWEVALAGRFLEVPLVAVGAWCPELGHVSRSFSRGSKLHMTSIQLQFIAKKKK